MEFREFLRNTREEESNKIELSKTIKIIAEGRATEFYYFTALQLITGHNRLLPNLDVRYIDKIGIDKDKSHPPHLYDWVISDISQIDGYGENGNEFEYYIVFDLDRSRRQKGKNEKTTLEEMIELTDNHSEIFLLNTNPCFELWLLLHSDKYELKFLNDEEILENKKLRFISHVQSSSKNQKYLTHLISETFSINSKKRNDAELDNEERRDMYKEKFLSKLDIAFRNEDLLCKGKINIEKPCSNIGKHIKRIIEVE